MKATVQVIKDLRFTAYLNDSEFYKSFKSLEEAINECNEVFKLNEQNALYSIYIEGAGIKTHIANVIGNN